VIASTLAWLIALAPVPSSSLAAQQADPLGRLQIWVERARQAPRSVDPKRQAELRAILGDLRLLRAGGAAPAALDLGLIELASLEEREEGPEGRLAESARLGRDELEGELARPDSAALATRLAREVLEPSARRPRAERLLAAELLEHPHAPDTRATLCAAAREPDVELGLAALRALSGWPDASVHAFFLEELERPDGRVRAATEHFERVTLTLASGQHEPGLLEPPVLARLQRECARRYLSEDWREAARAHGLVRLLDTPRAVPILIESLSAWLRRAGEGRGSKRILAEIVAELQRLSGRAVGADPENWSEWWQGVVAGRIPLPADVAAASGQRSSATFFGLHAVTDRVVFVVDRSGSMRTGFGTDGRSRHDEAIDQLLTFLERSGEDTRFTIALFGDEGLAWRSKLSPATATNRTLARRWLEEKPPGGETRLFQGLRAGLGLDARGHLALDRCEADTVIVLCDGVTGEGPGWVARWLAEENERAQLVFHCVQIGAEGNGTLEALATGTGGEFLRIPG
jgi:VWA domain-containing protein